MVKSFALGAVLCLASLQAGATETVPEPPGSTRALGGAAWEDTYLLPVACAQLRLSRSHVLWGSERALLDGRPLVAGRDYSLDWEAGLLRLTHPARAGRVLRVSFRAPLVLAEAAPPRSLPAPAPGGRLRSRLRSALYAANAVGPAFSGLPRLSASRAEANAGEALRDELLSGLRLTQYQERIAGAGRDSGTVAYFRADPIDPVNAIAGSEEFSTNLDLRPSSASRLRVLDSFARESLFTEDYEEQERLRVQFDQNFGKSTASLLWEHRRTDGQGVVNSLDALSLSLAHPFTRSTLAEGYFSFEDSLYRGRETSSLLSVKQRLGDAFQAQAGVNLRTSDLSGSTLETGATVSSQPVKGTDLTLALRQADSDRYGRYQKLSADITSALNAHFQIQGEASRRTSDQYGVIDTVGLGFAARPSTRSLLEAAFSQSTGQVLGREGSGTVRLSVDPSQALRLQLGYDISQSSLDGASQNALWLVTVGGKRYVKLEGYAALHDPKDAAPFRDSLYRLEVRPVEPFALSAQLRRVFLEQEDRAVAGVGADLRMSKLFELTAAYRKPAVAGSFASDIAGQDLRLSFLPLGGLRVFGEYASRPEDERGGLLNQVNRSLGLETSLGSFSLQGSVTRMDGKLVTEPGQRLDFLASLKMGNATKLYGGFRTQDPVAADQQRSQVYRLGMSRTAGAAFLLLEGQFGWLVDGSGVRTWSADDTLAQARVGLRF